MAVEDPRTRRLRSDLDRMTELKARSDLIDFEVFLNVPGVPPERYVVSFKCRGIAAVDAKGRPLYSEYHKVAIYLDASYPSTPPRMKWLTPIWHPNIEHKEPRRVCIDNAWWAPGRSLDHLVVMLGEMVQYKNYHADPVPPYALDTEVASWVLWAESQGILTRGVPTDPREIRRPERVRAASPPQTNGPSHQAPHIRVLPD